MGREKVFNSLNEESNYIFLKRKWIIVNDQSNANDDAGNEIINNTEILKSDLLCYNNVSILVRGDITVVPGPPTQLAFKNCAPFTKCITKIDGTTIVDGEDLDWSYRCTI